MVHVLFIQGHTWQPSIEEVHFICDISSTQLFILCPLGTPERRTISHSFLFTWSNYECHTQYWQSEDTGIYVLLPPIHNPYQSCCFFCMNSATLSVVQICKLGEPAGWSFVTAAEKSLCKPRGTETKRFSMNGTRALCRYSNYTSFLILYRTVLSPEFIGQRAQIKFHDHTHHLECSDCKHLLLRVYQSINVH